MHNIDDLRKHLFETLASLKDGKMDIDRAKAVSDVAQTIINSAKVEVEYAKATGTKGSTFLEKSPELPQGITGIHQHRIK